MIEALASGYTSMKQAEVLQATSVAVLRRSMDIATTQAEGVVRLLGSVPQQIEPIRDPDLGTRVDTFA